MARPMIRVVVILPEAPGFRAMPSVAPFKPMPWPILAPKAATPIAMAAARATMALVDPEPAAGAAAASSANTAGTATIARHSATRISAIVFFIAFPPFSRNFYLMCLFNGTSEIQSCQQGENKGLNYADQGPKGQDGGRDYPWSESAEHQQYDMLG